MFSPLKKDKVITHSLIIEIIISVHSEIVEIRKEVEALYEAYIISDFKWTEYYKDEYTLASQDVKIQTKYADSLKSQWADIYDKNEIIFRNHGDINIVASEDQALNYNTYD